MGSFPSPRVGPLHFATIPPLRGRRVRERRGGKSRATAVEMTGLLFAGRLGEVEFDFVDVAPAPRFAGLERTHDRVLGAVEVFGGVFVLGGIAAANVSAFEAETKVDPGVTHFQALFATVGVGIDLVDVREVCAGRHAVLLQVGEMIPSRGVGRYIVPRALRCKPAKYAGSPPVPACGRQGRQDRDDRN